MKQGLMSPPDKEPTQQPTFNVGDVVRLKSGGPWMTVASVKESGLTGEGWQDGTTEPVVFTRWFNGSYGSPGSAVSDASFPASMLYKRKEQADA